MTVRSNRVSYQVTATVEPQLTAEFERFMVQDHIPALLATGCFASAAMVRFGPGRYHMRYEAASRAELDRYFAAEAARVRGEFTARFPSGIVLARETGDVLAEWGERGNRPAE